MHLKNCLYGFINKVENEKNLNVVGLRVLLSKEENAFMGNLTACFWLNNDGMK